VYEFVMAFEVKSVLKEIAQRDRRKQSRAAFFEALWAR